MKFKRGDVVVVSENTYACPFGIQRILRRSRSCGKDAWYFESGYTAHEPEMKLLKKPATNKLSTSQKKARKR